MFRRLTLPLVALLSSLNAAHSTGEIESLITEKDRERLARYDAARSVGIDAAGRASSATARKAFEDAVHATPLPLADFDLTGDWQCRTLKAGGPAELVVYGWFDCRVTDDGAGWQLEKLTGSQLTTGRFFTESDTRMTYLGSFFVSGDAPRRYGTGPESDQVGYAIRTGEQRWQIEFPFPHYESKYDILELRR